MKTRKLTLGVLAFLCLSVLIYACSGNEVEEATDDAGNSSGAVSDNPDSLCYANPLWFPHADTPAPEEGKGSPFDVSETTNQIFHQWSWKKLLHTLILLMQR